MSSGETMYLVMAICAGLAFAVVLFITDQRQSKDRN